MSDEQRGRGRMCYACGVENAQGLHMEFAREGERTVSVFSPCDQHQGFPGRMHGGLVATMIDEAMGWAVYHAQAWGATARLNVRFRQPVPLDAALRVEAWVTNDRSRLIELRGELRDGSGTLLAEADGTFMKLDRAMAGEMSALARDAGRSDMPEIV